MKRAEAGQNNPVTNIWADLRKEAGQEQRHFETEQKTGSSAPRARLVAVATAATAGQGSCPTVAGSCARRGCEAGPLHREPGQSARRLSPRCGAPRPGGTHPPARGPCVPETASWLPSTPGPSPTPPADPRRAAALQKPGPSDARRSDICSPRGDLLRRQQLAAPETAEVLASAAAASRRAERSPGPEDAARQP